jgi:hypothetical protein
MPLDAPEQGRHRRQDAGSKDKDWAQPEDEGKKKQVRGHTAMRKLTYSIRRNRCESFESQSCRFLNCFLVAHELLARLDVRVLL